MKITKLSAIFLLLGGFCHVSNASQNLPGVSAKPASYFFTGKPFDADLNSYVFKARNFNPNMNRWITADPSGFPDGANNHIYCAAPSFQLDPAGLLVTAVYTIHSQILVIGDDDGNEFVDYKYTGCNSGDNNPMDCDQKGKGPIPVGSYSIYTRHDFAADFFDHMAFILQPDSGTEVYGRSDFRIHCAGLSEGCIATSSIDAIGNVLKNTTYDHNSTTPITSSDGVVFNEYYLGTLLVVE